MAHGFVLTDVRLAFRLPKFVLFGWIAFGMNVLSGDLDHLILM